MQIADAIQTMQHANYRNCTDIGRGKVIQEFLREPRRLPDLLLFLTARLLLYLRYAAQQSRLAQLTVDTPTLSKYFSI